MDQLWWKEAVVYQIYPRSFMDSNGDGVGDLRGITQRLDYLKNLGINVIWLCPIYQSPNDDNGYDISNYFDIAEEYGTMVDFEEMLQAIHARGMRLIMDLVVNHTSDEHSWFVESRKSKDNPYRDYYFWRSSKDGMAPNNWGSVFGGPAWEFDPQTNEYYLHLFSRKQPDLNWDHPEVRRQVHKIMRFWLEKGIDGFRMDVINMISKVPDLPSVPVGSGQVYGWGGPYVENGPHVHEYLVEMREQVLDHYDTMTVGETGGVTPMQALLYAGSERRELNMVFQFEHSDMDSGQGGKWDIIPWTLDKFKNIMTRWQVELFDRAWNSLYLNNHDQPRSVSRWGNDDRYRVQSAKMLATFLHMQQGTPFVYQGEEIGMTNVAFDSIEDYHDVEIHNLWQERVINGGEDPESIMKAIHAKGRDNARTPMQWNDDINAGFTNGDPWIKINPNYSSINVEHQLQDEDSIYHYYQRLIRLRKNHPIMVYGKYELITRTSPDIYVYTRTLGEEKWIVINNFFAGTPKFIMPEEFHLGQTELVIANYDVMEESGKTQEITLRPYETRVYRWIGTAS